MITKYIAVILRRRDYPDYDVNIKPRLHQGYMLPGNMLPTTKLLSVCCPSVAGYKGIHVAEIQATCCRQPATCCPGVNAAYDEDAVFR